MKLPTNRKNRTSAQANKFVKLAGQYQAEIIGLTHEAQGVARLEGKTVFVENALPGDLVKLKIMADNAKFATAKTLQILEKSADRVEPFCQYFGKCGGCSLQHLTPAAQIQWKQANLIDQLQKSLNCKKLEILPPIQAEDRNYRRRAKLVLVRDKQDKTARLGFKAQTSEQVIDIESCPILTPALNQKLTTARFDLLPLASRQAREVFLVEDDNNQAWLSSEIHQAAPAEGLPQYQINNLNLAFEPTGFIQVNREINQQLVAQTLDTLELKPTSKVLDLFCGVGNFTLPIADILQDLNRDLNQSQNPQIQVVGVEGNARSIELAKLNASANQLNNVEFYQADLFSLFAKAKPQTQLKTSNQAWLHQEFDLIVLDPGRLGAKQVCDNIASFNAQKIVYISCQASTLIRDLQVLETHGYRLRSAQIFDMFAHTNHYETLVVMEKI